MIRRFFLVLAAALALAGCAHKAPAKTYDMQGDVVALDSSTKTATIKAGPIGDWMEAMTMEYPVKPDSEFLKLHVGDHIRAKVVVEDTGYYVTSAEVVK
ncbi:MAG TPA: copper-binding protein [Bryobacteraceae bacterium]|nr:copper-binding protein [Bryobacteraceae bacterium]